MMAIAELLDLNSLFLHETLYNCLVYIWTKTHYKYLFSLFSQESGEMKEGDSGLNVTEKAMSDFGLVHDNPFTSISTWL